MRVIKTVDHSSISQESQNTLLLVIGQVFFEYSIEIIKYGLLVPCSNYTLVQLASSSNGFELQ